MAGTARNDLVSKLRSRLSDDRASVAAFSISATDQTKEVILEIANGALIVTPDQAQRLRPLQLNLSDPRYSTVGRLFDFFDGITGYAVVPDPSINRNHPSIDITVDGLPDISNKKPTTLRHHIFSDNELNDILMEAVTLHNPNYTNITSVPKSEYPYVTMKAQAHAYRIIAADSAKRKGLDADAKTFLALARDMEEQYTRDHRRQERIIPAAKADESKMGAGDVVNGMMFRRNLRAGYYSSYRNALPPTPPNLYDFADDDVEDTQIRLRWSQNREQGFSYYEVWRDTQPNVERSISGRLTEAYPNNEAGTGMGPALPISTQYSRAATARQVLGVSAGANRISPVFDGFFFWTAAELAGSNIVNATFIDGLIYNNPGSGVVSVLGEPLEPETDYYYRVFALNWNGEVVPSKVLKGTTKGLRAKFARIGADTPNANLSPTAIVPTTGPLDGGTMLTITGTNFPATGLVILLNGKPCGDVTILSSTKLICTTPPFTNPDWLNWAVDIVMVSPSGLKDIVQRGFTYTSLT